MLLAFQIRNLYTSSIMQQDTTTKKWLLRTIAFCTGSITLIYELAAARALAPYVGASTFVWASVIGVILLAISMGAIVGGKAADLRKNYSDIVYALVAASIFIAISKQGLELVGFGVVALELDLRLEAFILSLCIFAPASFFLGFVSPYLAVFSVDNLKKTGVTVAGLDASNTIGSIFGTFVAGYILFSYFGLQAIFAFLSVSCLFLCVLIAKKKVCYIVISIALLMVSAIAFQNKKSSDQHTLVEIDTANAHYLVVEEYFNQREIKSLISGPGARQSGVYVDKHLRTQAVFSYVEDLLLMAGRAVPTPKRIAVLGGGAYTMPQLLSHNFPNSMIDVVEIDPDLEAISEKHFYYTAPSNVKSYHQDARTFLQQSNGQYDLIIVDVFNNLYPPPNMTTVEFGNDLATALATDGSVLSNIIGTEQGECSVLPKNMLRIFKGALGSSRAYKVSENHSTEPTNTIVVGGKLANRSVAEFNDITNSLVIEGYHTAQPVFTDDYTPTDLISLRCSKT